MATRPPNLEHWLHYQPREFSVVIAARAGLRVAPLLAGAYLSDGPRNSRSGDQVMTGFRVLAATWCAAKYPHRSELRIAAGKAAHARAYFNIDAAMHDPACACAIAVTSPIAATYAASAVAAVNIAARDCGYAAEADAACTTDADLLADGVPPSALIDRPIWHEEPPAAVLEQWPRLKSWLRAPEENWEVWTDWCEARMRGDPALEELETARVLEPTNNEWLTGAATANARVKQIIARFAAPP